MTPGPGGVACAAYALHAAQSAAITGFSRPATVATMAGYFVIVALIGIWATRRTKSARDFFVAGQRLGTLVLGISAMAATLSGFAFIGGPGLFYSAGTTALFIVLPASLTNTLGAWVLAKRLRLLGEVRGLITIPDAIGARYRSPAAQGISAVAILVALVGYTATNFLALGYVLDAVFGTGLSTGIWIGALVTLAYSVSGGILAGVYNDVFQGITMAAASVAAFAYAMHSGGGLAGISATITASDATFLSPWGTRGALAALSLFFVFGVGSLAQPHIAHKYFMVREPERLRWYPLVMTVAMSLTLLLYLGVGVAVKALVVNGTMPPLARPDDAMPAFLLHAVPTAIAGVVFAGVAAAIMSTVNSFLSVGAAALMHDLPVAMGRKPANELSRGRIATTGLALVAAIAAQAPGAQVAFLGVFGYGLFASTLVPALAVGLNWPGATRAGAIASITTGLVLTLVGETLAYCGVYSLPAGVSWAGVSLVASLLVFFGVSWLTRARADGELDPDVRLIMEV